MSRLMDILKSLYKDCDNFIFNEEFQNTMLNYPKITSELIHKLNIEYLIFDVEKIHKIPLPDYIKAISKDTKYYYCLLYEDMFPLMPTMYAFTEKNKNLLLNKNLWNLI